MHTSCWTWLIFDWRLTHNACILDWGLLAPLMKRWTMGVSQRAGALMPEFFGGMLIWMAQSKLWLRDWKRAKKLHNFFFFINWVCFRLSERFTEGLGIRAFHTIITKLQNISAQISLIDRHPSKGKNCKASISFVAICHWQAAIGITESPSALEYLLSGEKIFKKKQPVPK